MSSGDWMCGSCEHMNFKKKDSCQRCRYPKYGGSPDMSSYGINRTEVLAGDWYCSAMNCGAHNYASRTSCYRCGSLKNDYLGYPTTGMMPSGDHYSYEGNELPGWKTGDWICNRLVISPHFES